MNRSPACSYKSPHISPITRERLTSVYCKKDYQSTVMESPTLKFAGLQDQPLVLVVTLTSGLGFLYEHPNLATLIDLH